MKRYLVTITDNIAPTSMPYNEFVLYRKNHVTDEKQIVILLFKTKVNENESVPEDLELHCIGNDYRKLRRVVEDVFKRAIIEGAKVVFHIHEAKSVLLFNAATGFKYKDQIVYTLHSTYKNYPFHNKVFAQFASRQCGQVVCVSKTSYKYYPDRLKKRACCIQNGVDTERIDEVISGMEKRRNSVFTLIYVARFVELKRHKMLFDAMRSLPDVTLKLVGAGPLEQQLKEYAKEIGIEERVQFNGAMPRYRVYEALYEADAYVSTSSYEGLPIGVLEAMRCGLPCVLSDIEQHREIAEECDSLILCGDEKWSTGLEKLIRYSQPELSGIGIQNAEDVRKYFSLRTMHGKYESLYAKVER